MLIAIKVLGTVGTMFDIRRKPKKAVRKMALYKAGSGKMTPRYCIRSVDQKFLWGGIERRVNSEYYVCTY